MLENAGVLSLEQVMHDGAKIRALAGADTLRREKTLRERLKQAQGAEASGNKRRQAARERAERLEAALKELAVLQADKSSEEDKAAVRVSQQEPEARKNKIIVGAHLSQCSSDAPSLMAALEEVAGNRGKKPEQAVVDGGLAARPQRWTTGSGWSAAPASRRADGRYRYGWKSRPR